MPITTVPAYAFGTLTSSGVNVTAADTVTIGSVTYTFRASVSTTANEIFIGASAAVTLSNLKDAVNLVAAGSGVTYGSLTVVNPDVVGTTLTTTTLKLVSKVPGTIGNFIPFAKVATTLSVSAALFASGTASIWQAITDLFATEQMNAGVIQALKSIDVDSTAN